MAELWDEWIPGVLSKNQIKQLCDAGLIKGVANKEDAIDHSSIDLCLANEGYRLNEGSVKPFGLGFLNQVVKDGLATRIESDPTGLFHLDAKTTYLFKLKESIKGLADKAIYGRATAKSSVGRLDVLARLVVDGMRHYEAFTPDVLTEETDMFVEVTPITFPVLVKEGIPLTQLRLFYGKPENCEIDGVEVARTCFSGNDKQDNNLTVNLENTKIKGATVCGFCTSENVAKLEPIQLWKGDRLPKPSNWWNAVRADKRGRLRITKNSFYILRSKERLTLPPGIAVYARAIDEEIGEMRIHYAGFAHPLFGLDRSDDVEGTPLMFEVRGHDVDVSLRDGEILAGLKFFRMSENATREKKKPYNDQTLQLSNFFGDWSSAPRVISQG